MTEPAAAKVSLCDQVELPASVLQGLAALLNAHAHRRHPGRAGDEKILTHLGLQARAPPRGPTLQAA